MEALRKAGEEMGLDRDMATEMAIGTCLGAATLAEQSKDDLSQLRQNVTSKGGTTEQALNSFNTSNLDDVVHKAVFAALHRGRELAAEVEKSSKL
jgi:pyrroline-5-carboxylate reductase